jgi:hypothetical protein
VAIPHDTARREALAGKVGRLGTELADCLAEAYSIGQEAPDFMFGALLDLESWARELRGDPHGPTALLAQQVRERWLAALEEPEPPDELAAVIPLPVVGERSRASCPRWWSSVRSWWPRWRWPSGFRDSLPAGLVEHGPDATRHVKVARLLDLLAIVPPRHHLPRCGPLA